MNATTLIIIAVLVVGGILGVTFYNRNQFELPRGETREFIVTNTNQEEPMTTNEQKSVDQSTDQNDTAGVVSTSRRTSTRKVLVTDGVKHSIPLGEILSGGPPKDGIPSIDNPKFISTKDAEAFLDDSAVGLGVSVQGESRFYPYQILVWHEIVNDTIAGQPVLVTYCPLCATGIVFDRRVAGVEQEFGVSGKLWQSNLLMYNRAGNEKAESLWSQVLGEAVLGQNTGEKLTIVRSDTVLYGDWKKNHPDTKVLSRDTGAVRSYGLDPYGDYYTSNAVSFGATFSDTRLHPKAFVLGVEIDGAFKAYDKEALPVGTTVDTFGASTVTITRTAGGEITMASDGAPLEYIGGFWFSWLAVHPETELFK